MIEAAEQAVALADGWSVTELEADRLRRDCMLWSFTVLGEAAAQVSAEVKERFPEVLRRSPTSRRNRIVHGYWSVDLDILHTTATQHLGVLAEGLRHVLQAMTDEAAPGSG